MTRTQYLRDLIGDAKNVVANWEKGDLADSVNKLRERATMIEDILNEDEKNKDRHREPGDPLKEGCTHSINEDCMNCRECGECREDLNEDDVCPDCDEKASDDHE